MNIDKFCSINKVRLYCIPFYINKQLPTFYQFKKLLNDLKDEAHECGLIDGTESDEELYKKLITNEKILALIG